jgi:hypothetical protein
VQCLRHPPPWQDACSCRHALPSPATSHHMGLKAQPALCSEILNKILRQGVHREASRLPLSQPSTSSLSLPKALAPPLMAAASVPGPVGTSFLSCLEHHHCQNFCYPPPLPSHPCCSSHTAAVYRDQQKRTEYVQIEPQGYMFMPFSIESYYG